MRPCVPSGGMHTYVCFSWEGVVVPLEGVRDGPYVAPRGLEGVPAPSFLPFLLDCCLSPEAAPAHGRWWFSAGVPRGCEVWGEAVSSQSA